jgi:hypothetical protein
MLVAILSVPAAQAEIYKCVAEDGAVSYSQIPCPTQKTTTVPSAVPRTRAVVDCRWASAFAGEVTRRMRGGMASDALFDSYGGIDSVSSGTINIINYVYRFRGDEAIPEQRISSLAGSMCKAGSLGDVSCEALPYGQDPGGRCDAENIEDGLAEDDENRPRDGARQTAPAAAVDLQSSNQQQARVDGASDQCKMGIRDQIDAIDAQMREGYDSAQGERYRENLRALTTRLHNC